MNVPVTPDRAQQDPPKNVPGYAIAPNAVLRNDRLSRDARLLYVLLDGHAGKSGRVRVGDAVLAAELNASERSLYRWLAELQAADLITRKGTGRSAITLVHNGVRTSSASARTDRAGTAELTPVAALQRSNSREVNNNNAGPVSAPVNDAPAPTPATPAQPLQPYLDAVRTAAAAPSIAMNRKVKGELQKIASRGVRPEELGVEVAAWLAVRETDVVRVPGFTVGVILPAIAAGYEVPSAEPLLPTPVPPPYVPEPDAGGDAAAGIAAVRAALAATQRQEINA